MPGDLQAVLGDLDALGHLFDFTRDGFAERIAGLTAETIGAAIDAQEAPDGSAWPAPGTARESHRLGVATGRMRDPMELVGTLQIAPDRLVQTYGVTDQAKQEAAWFQEGDGARPPRPFYAFNSEALARLSAAIDAHGGRSLH